MAGYTQRKKKQEKDPQEDIIKLNKVIEEQSFSNIHLLYGPEDYLRLQFRDNLVKAMGGVPGSLSYTRFTGKDVDAKEVIDLADTLPFMAERRVILVEETGWFKNGNSEIEEYIEAGVNPDTCIVFCEKEIDKKRKIYTLTKNTGVISEFMNQTETTLNSWIRSRMNASGITIGPSEASYLINLAGTDMSNLAAEIEKLTSYCLMKGRAGREDIDTVCSRCVENRIFDMCENIALGKPKRAVEEYQDLISLKEKPMGILIRVQRHFEMLLTFKDLDLKKKYSDKELSEFIKRPEWTISKSIRPQVRFYSRKDLSNILSMLVDLQADIVNGLISDEIVIEVAIAKISGLRRAS